MFDFEQKFLKNREIEKYKLIYIYGDESESERIIFLIKRFFLNELENFDGKDDIAGALLSNDMFQGRRVFLIEKIGVNFFKNKNLLENLKISGNILICLGEEHQQIDLDKKFLLEIELKKRTSSERGSHVDSLIKKYKLDIQPNQKALIRHLLLDENFLVVENEIEKLSLLMRGGDFHLTNEVIYNLFNLPSKTIINNLLEGILFKRNESFSILYRIIDKYDSILIIRSIYNYFLKLQKVFLIMILEKKPFYTALNEQYGLLIGLDKNLTKSRLESMNINIVNKILDEIVNCEVDLKRDSQRSIAIFENFLLRVLSF